MTFEEFFKKKRIDLDALQKAEATLFSEFKTHYAEMGEKSFDYTKKYWFNKIRREFPLAVEVKTEKPKIANPLAEQTITESLDEQIAAPKPGFVQRFKAANVAKPAVEPSAENKAEETPAAPPTPKPGFTPRFKAANMAKPATEDPTPAKTEEPAPTPPAPKPGFTPRFKAANMVKPAAQPEEKSPDVPAGSATPSLPENTEAKPGYKPRFNPKNIPKKDE